jgi:hypothetical protein
VQKIRVGFLSFFFRRHPVGRLLAPIITGLDPSRFEVYLLTSEEVEKRGESTPGKDEIVDFLRARVAPERRLLVPHYPEAAVEVVRSAHLDILVYGDVFMDSFVAHLAGLRLAAVQVVFWGHPYTTGHANIDYFVTSDTFEAENSQTRYIFCFIFGVFHIPVTLQTLSNIFRAFFIMVVGMSTLLSSWCALIRFLFSCSSPPPPPVQTMAPQPRCQLRLFLPMCPARWTLTQATAVAPHLPVKSFGNVWRSCDGSPRWVTR